MTRIGHKPLSILVCGIAAMGLYACGGGGDGTGSTTPPAATSTTVAGSIVKGPVGGATVTVRNAATGEVLGTATTNSTGGFSLNISFAGDIIIEANGGNYTDEATGATTPLSTPMRSVLTANGGTVNGVVTPLTTLAYTYAFGSSTSGVSASAFDTRATSLATQFQLNGVNLATTVPVVTGSTNAYGDVLRGVSRYMANNGVTLATFTTAQLLSTSSQWSTFNTQFNAAFRAANPNSSMTFAFTGNGLIVGGTGAGGGSGTCGVHVTGSVTANGFTVPLDLNYCVQGIAAASCDSGNATISQALSGQSGVVGAANLAYSYSASCAPGAFTITLQ